VGEVQRDIFWKIIAAGTCGCAGLGASSGVATTVSIFLGQQVLAEYNNGALL
jgi:hypothetical protein